MMLFACGVIVGAVALAKALGHRLSNVPGEVMRLWRYRTGRCERGLCQERR